MKRLVKVLCLTAMLVGVGTAAQAQFRQSIFLNGNIPTGDFASDASNGPTLITAYNSGVPLTYEQVGKDATVGFGLGYRASYRFDIGYGLVAPFANIDFMWNTISGKWSDKYLDAKFSSPTYFNIPLLAGVSYIYDDPDCDTNGVPDRWEGTGYVYGFTDANHDGFPDGLTFPTAGDGNFDIEVTVTTTRSALLSWGEGTSKGIVLPPCDGQVVRVRLEKAEETNIRLVCGLPNDGADGLWKARYSVGWASGRDQQTEGNRIQLGDGTVIDIDGGGAVSFRGEMVSVPTRGGGSYPPDPIPLRLKWIHIDCFDGVCWEHDSGGYSVVAIFTNVAPPFAWYVDGNPVQGVTGDTLGGWDIIDNWLGWDWAEIRCVATNGLQHEAILVEDWNYVSVGHCPPGATNFYPITSLPEYDVIAEHEPDYESTPNQYGPNCPETETLDIWAGFAHGGEKPCERNFETIPTGDPKDDNTSHCHAIDWSDGLEIDLAGFILGFGFGRGDNDWADDKGAKVYDVHAAYEFDYAGQHLRPYVDYKSFQTTQHNELHAGVEAGLSIGGFGFRAVYGFHGDYLMDDGDVVENQDWTSTAHAFLVEPTFEVGMFDIKTTAFYAIVDRGDAAEDASDLDNGEIPEYFFLYAEPAFKFAEFIKVGVPVEYHTNTLDDDDDTAATFDVGARVYISPVENLEITAFGMVDIPVQDNEDDDALRFGLETVFSF